MKKLASQLFGEINYTDDEVITFPSGLLGFPDFRHYILREHPAMKPIVFLISIDPEGPEVAMVKPEAVSAQYAIKDVPLDEHMQRRLKTKTADGLSLYAIVTLPENMKKISMNLRTPVLINPSAKRGMEYPAPGLENEPVRCLIYRELIASRPQDKPGNLVMHRKVGETIEIGDEISIQICEFVNGGVKLSVSAPKHVKISRGEGLVTPKQETIRAASRLDLRKLEALMQMHQVMQDPEASLPPTVLHTVPGSPEKDELVHEADIRRAGTARQTGIA